VSTFLELMNRHEYPEFKAGVHVVKGRHGELFVCTRPVEAWQRWAETNGYNNWGVFAEDYEDEIEWSDGGRKGFLDEGGSIEYVEVEGYYRDGAEHL
jgi:hypothetical protein